MKRKQQHGGGVRERGKLVSFCRETVASCECCSLHSQGNSRIYTHSFLRPWVADNGTKSHHVGCSNTSLCHSLLINCGGCWIQGSYLLWSTGALSLSLSRTHTHTFAHRNVPEQLSVPLVKLKEPNSCKPSQWEQPVIMGEGSTRVWKDPQDARPGVFCSGNGKHVRVCVCMCACRMVATQLAQLLCFCQAQIHCVLRDDQPVLLSLLMFVCSSHQLRLKRLDEGNGTTEALPATTQPLLLPGLPLSSLSRCHQFIPYPL